MDDRDEGRGNVINPFLAARRGVRAASQARFSSATPRGCIKFMLDNVYPRTYSISTFNFYTTLRNERKDIRKREKINIILRACRLILTSSSRGLINITKNIIRLKLNVYIAVMHVSRVLKKKEIVELNVSKILYY